jgi:transcriptional regulator with PAS, ATPase and Fis domain
MNGMGVSRDQFKLFELASRGESTVLLTGETGTGKTYLAKKIHDSSRRALKPFVVVNLATLHGGTLESELFGHERGSFTGADSRRVGKLEMAQGGTVFLDEVGELSLSLQARLLEFLQFRTISPVGSNRVIQLDVRVIAATHRDLEKAVQKGVFREDLFHRLRVISIPMKSLRCRLGEFNELLTSTLEEFSRSSGRAVRGISGEVAEIFQNYAWPGNFRELRNVIEYGVQSAEGMEIQVHDLPLWLLEAVNAVGLSESSERAVIRPQPSVWGLDEYSSGALEPKGSLVPDLGVLSLPLVLNYRLSKIQFEKEFLKRALVKNGGRINQTARQIGVNKSTLIRRMQHLGLKSTVSVVVKF